ncbi:MAG: cell division regulator GpsB [Lactobacillus sp.]|nr:cell division regulator GpsB [Lactobacillus sp.]
MEDLSKFKLTTQQILKKQFRTKVKGYDPDEVDSFLDQIIADYETFSNVIEDLYGQIGTLQRQLMDAKRTAPQPVETREVENHSGEISTNMAIIQRLSTLERKVYNLEQHIYGLQDK